MARQVSPERKTVYYVGLILMAIGGLMFASTFLTVVLHIGDFGFDPKGAMLRAFGGMALLIIGGIVSGIGARRAGGFRCDFGPGEGQR